MTEERIKQFMKELSGLGRAPDTVDLDQDVITACWFGSGTWHLRLLDLLNSCCLTGKALKVRKETK